MNPKNHLIIFSLGTAFVLSSFLPQNKDVLQESIQRGEAVYAANCVSCHMQDGKGIASVFPPLENSDYLMEDTHRAIRQIKNGISGEITVNGEVFDGDMPPQPLSEKELADVMNFIRNSWGNKGKIVTEADVKAALK